MSIDLQTQLELGLRLLLAVVLGGIVGFNRERGGHPAGLGTFALVTLGACVFSIVSDLVFVGQADNTRIASGIVEGIGFLGAGIILTGLVGHPDRPITEVLDPEDLAVRDLGQVGSRRQGIFQRQIGQVLL